MSWRDLLAKEEVITLPWAGGRKVHSSDRTYNIKGRTPPEHGWYEFAIDGGRKTRLKGEAEADPDFEQGFKPLRGYLVGDRFIADDARVDPDPDKLIEQTEPVFLVEPGLERFTRGVVVRDREDRLIYIRQEWPEGAEAEVLMAYQDRKDSVADIPGVTPALDLAFQWISWGRERAEERARELARLRAEEEARLEAEAKMLERIERLGTGAGRREMAAVDFHEAARAALAISGSELLDVIDTHNRNEVRVQYRFRHRRLECIVDRRTLQIVDAGVCLDDHRGTKGDTYFTLESLPAVIGEAMDLHKLVVWRHAPGDQNARYDDYDDEDY